MNGDQDIRRRKYDVIFNSVAPMKLTEAKSLKLYNEGWGLLTEFYLESVKINKLRNGGMCSTATLKVGDISGQTICVAKGHITGLLFDLTPEEWADVEKLNTWGDQLFYRYFRNGLKKSFNYEQKLFYNFCMSNQTQNTLAVAFRRTSNMRSVDKDNAVLEILDIRQCNELLLDMYIRNIERTLIE